MQRRGFLAGLIGLAAPAVIRAPGLLMPVRALVMPDVILDVRSGNVLLAASIIARESLLILQQKLAEEMASDIMLYGDHEWPARRLA